MSFTARRITIFGLAIWAGFGVSDCCRAEEDHRFVRCHAIYLTLKAQYESHPEQPETAWKFGRACFDWADFSSSPAQREKIAKEGMDACRHAIEAQSSSAPAHYYLALNLGQLARTRSLGALKLVRQMEMELMKAAELDPKLDYAGPDRSLGILYLQSPPWPTSIGSAKKAKKHLQRAIELSPNYPENHLNLLEANLRLRNKQGIEQEIASMSELWPRAKKEFSGEHWAASWADWERHWERLQNKIQQGGEAEQGRGKAGEGR